jgi:CRP-like cAMP-binding protein
VERQAFLRLLADHPELCMHVIRMLNENLKGLYQEFRLAGGQPARRYRRTSL